MKIEVISAALVAMLVVVPAAAGFAADATRQSEVERASKKVMPFSMDATKHSFEPTPDGGVETVRVTNGDAAQVPLIRSHLRKEADAFAHGDFADPASIHGGTMPGLKAMHDGAERISVHYVDIPNGASIIYVTHDPALVSAIHAWFKAQVSDHGAHATMKM